MMNRFLTSASTFVCSERYAGVHPVHTPAVLGRVPPPNKTSGLFKALPGSAEAIGGRGEGLVSECPCCCSLGNWWYLPSRCEILIKSCNFLPLRKEFDGIASEALKHQLPVQPNSCIHSWSFCSFIKNSSKCMRIMLWEGGSNIFFLVLCQEEECSRRIYWYFSYWREHVWEERPLELMGGKEQKGGLCMGNNNAGAHWIINHWF